MPKAHSLGLTLANICTIPAREEVTCWNLPESSGCVSSGN